MINAKKHQSRDIASLFMLLIYAVLILSLFTLTYISSSLYRSLTDSRSENESTRNSVVYIEGKLLGSGEKGVVKTLSTDDGDVLIIKEGNTGYETRIFKKDGYLCEAFVKSGSEVQDGEFEKICEISSFSAKKENGDLIKITANGKTAFVFLRCEGGTQK